MENQNKLRPRYDPAENSDEKFMLADKETFCSNTIIVCLYHESRAKRFFLKCSSSWCSSSLVMVTLSLMSAWEKTFWMPLGRKTAKWHGSYLLNAEYGNGDGLDWKCEEIIVRKKTPKKPDSHKAFLRRRLPRSILFKFEREGFSRVNRDLNRILTQA